MTGKRFCWRLVVISVLIVQAVLVGFGQIVTPPAVEPGSSTAAHTAVESLPLTLQYALSRDLGRDDTAYHPIQHKDSLYIRSPYSGFTAELNHAGLQVHSGAEDWELSLQQWGRGDVLHPLPAAQMGELEANRAAFDRGVLVEWFLNGPLGLQHGWEIQQPPPGEGDQPLSLSFNQGGSLHAVVESSERALELTNSSGASSLNYSGLLAFDARGHELPAWFETLDDRVLVRVADAGAHYPITVDPWLQSAKLTAGDFSDQDQLGYSVAVSADGSTIVGAAPQSLAASDAPGVVYVYERPAAWASTPLYTARLTASDGVHADRLGSAVSISADGGTIAVGAEFNAAGGLQRGAVYIFTRPQSGWVDTVESAKLTASDGLDGDLLGRAVDLSHNGSTLVAGAHGADLVIGGSSRGAAYVFQRPSSGWETNTETAKLTASDAADYNWLGWFVAANEDGSLIAASAWGYDGAGGYNRGLVYLFERPAGGWVDATESARLTSSTTQDGRGLGYSLDMTLDGGILVAGTYADSAGRAYLYERPEGGWTDAAENATLDTGGTDYIGMSVAIDESGDTIAVGDPWYNGLEVDTGSVYVFHKPLGGWSGNVNFNARLTASDLLAEDYLGKSVVLTADGGTLVAGAAGYDAGGSERGALYVYESPPGGWATTNSFDAKLTVGDAHNSDHLGDTVAISADGRTVVAGAEGYNGIYNNIGAVYVYERPGVDWNSTAVFSARLTASDAEEGDKLGSSIAVSGDGSTIAAGAYMQDVTGTGINRGAVYVFERPAGGWATTNHFEAMLTASDGQDGDHLGGSDSLAICNTGGTIAVGANLHDLDGDNRGAVYVFERPVSGWGSTDEFDAKLTSDEAEDDDRLGHAVGISGDASTIGVGSPGQDAGGLDNGAVYVYLRQPGGWTSTADFHAKLTASDGVHEDYFGIDQIALDDTGTTVIVGYPATNDDRGAVYVFTRPTSGWSSTIEQAQLSASDGIAFDLFGKSAAISLDGSTVISGAYYHNDSRGAVYVYKRPEGGWESTDAFFAKLTASDAGWDDSFGYSASVSGDGSVVISGARDEFRTGGVGQGSAYIFAYYAAPLFTSGAPPSPIPVGSLYSHTFKTTNFPESTFSITSGSLPPGLALDSPSGLLTGTPDTVGTYNFTVTASNGIDPDATQDATIIVQPGTYHCFLPVLSNGD